MQNLKVVDGVGCTSKHLSASSMTEQLKRNTLCTTTSHIEGLSMETSVVMSLYRAILGQPYVASSQ